MTTDAIVIGSGTAGLAAATALAAAGARVAVVEARAVAGGRARSWVHPATGDPEDNGQHVILGCYTEFMAFLRRIGAADGVVFQDRPEVILLERGGQAASFRPGLVAGALGLLAGLALLPGFPAMDAARLATRLRRTPPTGRTVGAWLDGLGQSAAARRRLWEPLTLATLNQDVGSAPAELLAAVLERARAAGRDGLRIGFPRAGLTPLFVEPALRFLAGRSCPVRLRTTVTALRLDTRGRFRAACLADGTELAAGCAVVAVPAAAAARVLPAGASSLDAATAGRLGASAIVATHLWYDAAVSDWPMAGFIGSPMHWVFDRARIGGARAPGYLAVVSSGARDLQDLPPAAIARRAADEVASYLPRARAARLVRWRVVKERAATPRFEPATLRLRPPAGTAIPNLVLAGDWIDTGLPATLEGAALSGHGAAAAVSAIESAARGL